MVEKTERYIQEGKMNKHVDKFVSNLTSREVQGCRLVAVIFGTTMLRVAFGYALQEYFVKLVANVFLWAFGIYSGVRTIQKVKGT